MDDAEKYRGWTSTPSWSLQVVRPVCYNVLSNTVSCHSVSIHKRCKYFGCECDESENVTGRHTFIVSYFYCASMNAISREYHGLEFSRVWKVTTVCIACVCVCLFEREILWDKVDVVISVSCERVQYDHEVFVLASYCWLGLFGLAEKDSPPSASCLPYNGFDCWLMDAAALQWNKKCKFSDKLLVQGTSFTKQTILLTEMPITNMVFSDDFQMSLRSLDTAVCYRSVDWYFRIFRPKCWTILSSEHDAP